MSGSTADADLVVSGDVTLTGTAAAGRTVRITGGTAASPRVLTLQGMSLRANASDTGGAIQLAPGAHARFELSGTNTLTGSGTFPGLGIPTTSSAVIAGGTTSNTLSVSNQGLAAAVGGDGTAVLVDSWQATFVLTGQAEASCGALTISGGTVNATVTGNDSAGAAIGGGRFGAGCAVTITGGVVNASATGAAGIGGGYGEDGKNGYMKWSPGGAGGAVRISGGTVSATSTGNTSLLPSAAIGGGRGGSGGAEDQGPHGAAGSLVITGGSVKLTPRAAESMSAEPSGGSQPLGLVKVTNAAGVSQVMVTPDGGSASSLAVSANHPSDNTLYLWLPYPKKYSLAVTTASGVTNYTATLAATGQDVNASVQQPPANLSVVAPTFDSAPWGYTPVEKSVTIQNTGGTAASVSAVTVSPATAFTVTKPATVNVPANGTNSTVKVQPLGGLGVGRYDATLTVTWDTNKTITAPISFVVTGEPNVVVTPPAFAAVVQGAALAAGKLTVANTGTAPVTLSGVSSSAPGVFQVDNSTATIKPGESVTLTVRPAANLAVGTHRATLTVAYAGSAATAAVSITVQARPAPPPPAPTTVAVRAGQATVALVKGKSITIPALAYLDNGKTAAVTWVSDKPAIATVSSTGAIKAVKAGSATITAVSGSKKATIKVTVLAKASKAKVKSVSGNVPKTMKVGGRAYITAKFSPAAVANAKITFSSTSKAVLAVDSAGTLTAVKKGKVTITIKAASKSRKYTVTVN